MASDTDQKMARLLRYAEGMPITDSTARDILRRTVRIMDKNHIYTDAAIVKLADDAADRFVYSYSSGEELSDLLREASLNLEMIETQVSDYGVMVNPRVASAPPKFRVGVRELSHAKSDRAFCGIRPWC